MQSSDFYANIKRRTLPNAYIAVLSFLIFSSPTFAKKKNGFVSLFNGKDWTGWNLKIRSGDEELAKKVFAIENGMVHVFKNFPENYELNTKKNSTHGLFYTQKRYSKFIFRFEYKWGKNICNNFDQFQYDAGMYYHVYNDAIWPKGIEYQVRYDNTTNTNHTGDYWAAGTTFQWYADANGKFLLPKDGGIAQPIKNGEHLALAKAKYNALNNKWNKCEIIVMGDKYSIHKLNGVIVNMATNLSVSKGIIGLQAETAEIYYRKIEIKELNKFIPMEKFIQ